MLYEDTIRGAADHLGNSYWKQFLRSAEAAQRSTEHNYNICHATNLTRNVPPNVNFNQLTMNPGSKRFLNMTEKVTSIHINRFLVSRNPNICILITSRQDDDIYYIEYMLIISALLLANCLFVPT